MTATTTEAIAMELQPCDLFAIYGGLGLYLAQETEPDVREVIGECQQRVCLAILACDSASDRLRQDASRTLVRLDKWLGVNHARG